MAAKLNKLTQKSDTTAPIGRDLYHLQFSRQAEVWKLLATPSYFLLLV